MSDTRPHSIYAQYLPPPGGGRQVDKKQEEKVRPASPPHPPPATAIDPTLAAGVLAALAGHQPVSAPQSAAPNTVIEVLARLVNVQEDMNARMDRLERAVVGVVHRIEAIESSLNNGSSSNSQHPPPQRKVSPHHQSKRHRDAFDSPPPEKRPKRSDDKRSAGPSFAGDPCYNCGACDHISRECPEDRQTCANCGKPGHLIDFCFQPIRNTHKAKPPKHGNQSQQAASGMHPSLLDSLFKQHVSTKPVVQPVESVAKHVPTVLNGGWINDMQSIPRQDPEEDGEVY